jgi:hypothetical protein
VQRKKYNSEHREEILARNKRYTEGSREERNLYCKKYYAIHREEILAKSKEYRKNNKEKLNAYQRKRYVLYPEKRAYAKWPEKHKEHVKNWKKSHPEQNSIIQKRARKKYYHKRKHST